MKHYPYTSAQAVRNELGNKATDADSEERILSCIMSATAYVDEYIGKSYQPHTFTEENPLIVPSGKVIDDYAVLPFRVRKIVSCFDNKGEIQQSTAGVYERALLFTRPVEGILHLIGDFGSEPPQDECDVLPGVPEVVRRATTLIAAAFTTMWRRERIGFDGVKQQILETSVPKDAVELLDRVKAGSFSSVF